MLQAGVLGDIPSVYYSQPHGFKPALPWNSFPAAKSCLCGLPEMSAHPLACFQDLPSTADTPQGLEQQHLELFLTEADGAGPIWSRKRW